LTWWAAGYATQNGVPVKFLTKDADWVRPWLNFINNSNGDNAEQKWRKMLAFGFTLTGHDELEPYASTNQERIFAMKKLHNAGFKTFASIEPVITFHESLLMIGASQSFCDLFKIGLMSGKKYEKWRIKNFIQDILNYYPNSKIYFKDSLLKAAGIKRNELPENCVGRDYNLFK